MSVGQKSEDEVTNVIWRMKEQMPTYEKGLIDPDAREIHLD
jgi:hypothetical protein